MKRFTAIAITVALFCSLSTPALAISSAHAAEHQSPVAEAFLKPFAVVSSTVSTFIWVPLAAITGIFNYKAVPGLTEALVVEPWTYVVTGKTKG